MGEDEIDVAELLAGAMLAKRPHHRPDPEAAREFAESFPATFVAIIKAAVINSAEESAVYPDWRPIETAPKDGTTIQARIPGHGDDNLIAWVEDALRNEGGSCGAWAFTTDQEPPPCWTDGWCWGSNEDGVPSVHPTHWMASPAEARSDKPAAGPETCVGCGEVEASCDCAQFDAERK